MGSPFTTPFCYYWRFTRSWSCSSWSCSPIERSWEAGCGNGYLHIRSFCFCISSGRLCRYFWGCRILPSSIGSHYSWGRCWNRPTRSLRRSSPLALRRLSARFFFFNGCCGLLKRWDGTTWGIWHGSWACMPFIVSDRWSCPLALPQRSKPAIFISLTLVPHFPCLRSFFCFSSLFYKRKWL